MKCKHCGGEIANDSRFCEYCGKKIKTGRLPWWAILLITFNTLLCIACGIGVVWYFQSLERDPGEPEDSVRDTISTVPTTMTDYDGNVPTVESKSKNSSGADREVKQSQNPTKSPESKDSRPREYNYAEGSRSGHSVDTSSDATLYRPGRGGSRYGTGNRGYTYMPDLTVSESGTVYVEVRVDANGDVQGARVINTSKYKTTITNSRILSECVAKAKTAKYSKGKEELRLIVFKCT